MTLYDLTSLPGVKRLLTNRWPQLILRVIALGGFLFAITTGLMGTVVGSRNFAIIAVWIGWWAALILIGVPFMGRGWCSICPIPMPGEWLQNGTVLGPDNRITGWGLKRRWPRRLRNIWLQNFGFVILALFSAVVLTQPRVTAWLLVALLLIATLTSLIFERRTFCRYLCPVGGFIGLYSRLAPTEVRVRDTKLCVDHKEKTCYRGGSKGYGCPWNVYPGGLKVNTNCGTCMECIRSCPYDNIAVNLRPPGADLTLTRDKTLDESYKAFIMLGSALVYSVVMLGPWGKIKTAAFSVGSPEWWAYALGFLFTTLGLLPSVFYIASRVAHHSTPKHQTTRKTFVAFAYSLVPLGLAAWIAFSLSFVFANGSYLLPTLSDPFGWGWNLFGTANVGWRPYLTSVVPVLQVIVLLGGVFWASQTACQIAEEQSAPRSAAWAVIAFCTLITMGLLWLLVG